MATKILDKDLEMTEEEIEEMKEQMEGLHLDSSEGLHSLMLAYVEFDSVTNQWNVYSDSGTLIKPYPDKRSALKKKYQLEWYARVRAQAGKLVPNEIATVGNAPPPPASKKSSTGGTGAWKNPATQYTDPWQRGEPGSGKEQPTSQEDAEKQIKALKRQLRQPATIQPESTPPLPKVEKEPDEEGIYKPDVSVYNNIMKQHVTDKKQSVTENQKEQATATQNSMQSGPIQPMIEETGKIKETISLFRDGEWDFSKEMNLKFKVDDKFKKSILDNFVNNVRGQRIPIVDRHDPMNKAYGWILNIWETEYGLEAKPSYNPRGIQALENEEYGYHSPQVDFNYYDPETKKSYGPTLMELTLTNGPRIKRSSAVLKGFSESMINEGGKDIMNPREQMKKMLTEMLALMKAHPEAIDKQDTIAFTEAVQKVETELAELTPEKKEDTRLQELEAQVKKLMEDISKKETPKAEKIEEPTQTEETVEKAEAVLVASETKVVTPKEIDYTAEVEKEKAYLSELSQMKQVVDTLEKRLALSEQKLIVTEQEKLTLAEERATEQLNAFLSDLEEKEILKPVHRVDYFELLKDLQIADNQISSANLKLSEGTQKAQGLANRLKALLSESKQVWSSKELGSSPIPDIGKTGEDLLTEKALALAKERKIKLSEAISIVNKEAKVSFIPKERGSF